MVIRDTCASFLLFLASILQNSFAVLSLLHSSLFSLISQFHSFLGCNGFTVMSYVIAYHVDFVIVLTIIVTFLLFTHMSNSQVLFFSLNMSFCYPLYFPVSNNVSEGRFVH